MKRLFLLLALISSTNIYAKCDPTDIFCTGEDSEFEFTRFSQQEVFTAINAAANLVCKDGLCKLHSVTENDRKFTLEFRVGEGSNYNNSGGTTIITDGGSSGYGNGDDDYIGFTARYTIGKCTQTVNVPRALYMSMNRYLYGLMTEEGNTRRGFTPAEEAMIMFYTTVMKQTSGCNNT